MRFLQKIYQMVAMFLVDVECDSCFSICRMEYRSYLKFTKNETDIYCCKKCNNVKVRRTNLEKYGVVCNSQLESNELPH